MNLELHDDRAENSIMQTITIAVSAILIAAGLVTAPGLINNARDNNARTDLSNLATGQECLVAETGKYAAKITDITKQERVRTTLSSPNVYLVVGSKDTYVLFAESKSGSVFWRASDSAEVHRIDSWTTTAPSGYPVTVPWIGTLDGVKDDALRSELTALAGVAPMSITDAKQPSTTAVAPTEDATIFVVSSGSKYAWFELQSAEGTAMKIALQEGGSSAVTAVMPNGVYSTDTSAIDSTRKNVFVGRLDSGQGTLLTRNGFSNAPAVTPIPSVNSVRVWDSGHADLVVTFPTALPDDKMVAIQQYLASKYN
jgi:hypothetical protein